jgi:hypothetical protein
VERLAAVDADLSALIFSAHAMIVASRGSPWQKYLPHPTQPSPSTTPPGQPRHRPPTRSLPSPASRPSTRSLPSAASQPPAG